ncbi:hypothetical protein [Ruegeria sp. YS9]|uniref:hypothetical protein n=1 Tax=Ruegeria sp. YS9 TaxID=2966453 RepID=UPI00214C37F4|nr:hypothetical protein [Ruegeria sp. YS9]UUV08760.1 hypothetical protein NOR97_21045 [Ruegeria sp. YS9]
MRITARPRSPREHRDQLIRNAAFALLESRKAADLRRWLRDRRAKEENRQVVFLYDSDVVMSYCAPWKTGPADDNIEGNGVGQILPLQPTIFGSNQDALKTAMLERQQGEATARLLARRAILLNSEKLHPVYQLSEHYSETLDLYRIVRKEVDFVTRHDVSHIESRQRREIDNALVLLRAELRDPGSIEHIKNNVGEFSIALARRLIERSRSTHSAVREWDNYYELNTTYSGIFDIRDFVIPNHSDADPVSIPSFDDEPYKSDFESLTSMFERVIISFRGSTRKPERNVTDAQALAQLALLNSSNLSKKSKIRFVLITGDRNLVSNLSNKDGRFSALTNAFALDDFCDLHVHHLWSLVDSMIDEVGESDDSKPVMRPPELFSGLLAFQEEEDEQSTLRDLASGGRSRYASYLEQDDINIAYEKWASFSTKASSADRFIERFDDEGALQDKLKKDMLRVIAEDQGADFSWTRLQDLISETLSRERDRSNVIFSDMGADALMSAQINGARNPPDLMFDSLSKTDAIFQNLASPQRVYRTVAQFKNDFEAIKEDCYDDPTIQPSERDDRLEHYLKYLVLGAVVASADRWEVAEEHAASAISIIERSKRIRSPIPVRPDKAETSNISGREAYFLRSVSRRIRASRHYDVRKATEFLAAAENALETDQMRNEQLSISRMRFKNERLALSLATYYLSRHEDEANYCNGEFSAIRTALEALFSDREPVVTANLESDHLLRVLKDDTIRVGTAASIATNVTQVAVISRFRALEDIESQPIEILSNETLECALRFLISKTDFHDKFESRLGFSYPGNVTSEPKVICSELMFRYVVVGLQLVKIEALWCPDRKSLIDKAFGSYDGVAHYDPWRYERLYEFSKRILD